MDKRKLRGDQRTEGQRRAAEAARQWHTGRFSDSTKYSTIHLRLRRTRGPASGYRCTQCGGPAREWAWVHGTGRADIDNYDPMCARCHRAYDDNGRGNRGTTMSAEQRAKISAAKAGVPWSPARRAAQDKKH